MSELGETHVRREIVRVAREIVSDEIDPIAGSRQLISLRSSLQDPNDDVFLLIQGFESETDGYPLGETRSVWSPEYLRSADASVLAYVERARDSIKAVCREIIAKYSS